MGNRWVVVYQLGYPIYLLVYWLIGSTIGVGEVSWSIRYPQSYSQNLYLNIDLKGNCLIKINYEGWYGSIEYWL